MLIKKQLSNPCPRCGANLEFFKKGIRCKNTLITDVALAYLKKVKYGEKELKYMQFEKCNYFNFDNF
jgi:hypothetical protein